LLFGRIKNKIRCETFYRSLRLIVETVKQQILFALSAVFAKKEILKKGMEVSYEKI